jgi:hypothetical protein
MSEEELEENLAKLLSQLIDHETLECFGWPNESVDTVSCCIVFAVFNDIAFIFRFTVSN